MIDTLALSGISLPSPILSARVREVGDFLTAPTAARLTEEQRALSLGIARRLVGDIAGRIGGIDSASLWQDWLRGGLPAAQRLAAACFSRAEEHRWREYSDRHNGTPAPRAVAQTEDAAEDIAPTPGDPQSPVDRAFLSLQIADRRRFDPLGQPCIAVADLDGELFRSLALDIAAWRPGPIGQAGPAAVELDEMVRAAVTAQAGEAGIDAAASAYGQSLQSERKLSEAAVMAAARRDWPTLIALAAAVQQQPYGTMALALVSAEAAALPLLLAPLGIDREALAAVEASLATLPARAVASGGVAEDDYAALLTSHANTSDGEVRR